MRSPSLRAVRALISTQSARDSRQHSAATLNSADGIRLESSDANFTARIVQMITNFRRSGHVVARTDPLGLADVGLASRPDLQLASYNFSEEDLRASAEPVDLSRASANAPGGFTSTASGSLPLSALYERLCDVYAGSIGIEYMHINSSEEQNW